VSVNRLRDLPSVDKLVASIDTTLPRDLVVATARLALDQARADIGNGGEGDPVTLAAQMVDALERSSGVRVINATGVLLHTNLGRAPWSSQAMAAATHAAMSYTNLELDLGDGTRGRRGEYLERLLIEATGADAAMVVNNNAAALMLALSSTANGRAVPVSRGELIEIGGSYRLPDVMAVGGARLLEVGTTNRTRVGDYRVALDTHDCGAILKVHPSNYRVEGFTEEATLDELATLAGDDLPLLYDLGSGLLDSAAPWVPDWLRDEPAALQSLDQGAHLVMFSGDKLLGGPQAGIIVGAGALVERLRANPLARALRVDGVTAAALAATVAAYLDGEPESIPFWRAALASREALEARSATLAGLIGGTVEEGRSRVGAGSAPGVAIPSPVVRLVAGQAIFDRLLGVVPPVMTRRDGGDLVVDLRAVDPSDDGAVADAVVACR